MFLYYKIKHIFYNIKMAIGNLIKWFPIVIKDRDFDYYFIMNVLRFKINNTAKHINEHQNYVGFERDVERMYTCVRLIDKIQNEDYSTEYQEYYSFWHSELEDNSEEYFKTYPNTYRKVLKYCEKSNKKLIILNISNERHQKAIRILFKLLENNIEKWWD